MATASPLLSFRARVLAGASNAATSAPVTVGYSPGKKVWQCGSFAPLPCLSLHRGESCSQSRRSLSAGVAEGESSAHSRLREFGVVGARRELRRTPRAASEADLETEDIDWEVEPMRPLRPVEERFNIYHEKNVSEERLVELGIKRWSKWDCGPGVTCFWKWKVDELVYISKGCVEVVPEGCFDGAFFYAGDIVRFPKWLEASLTFDEDYEQYYKFLAYGD